MKRITLLLAAAIALCLYDPAAAALKAPDFGKRLRESATEQQKSKTFRIEPLGTATPLSVAELRAGFDDAVDCTVYVDEPLYALYDWLAGDEIYYAYQDLRFPKVSCDTTYPYVVTHIGMTLVLNYPGTMYMQVFLAEVDPLFSSPLCPVPGELIYLEDEFPIEIPGAGVYSIAIALAEPVPVYGPYFACIYYGGDMTQFVPGIAIDSIPYICINYNEWGEGLTDLTDNDYYNFPGSIHLYSVGYSKAGTLPKPRFVLPVDSGVTFPGKQLWVADRNDLFEFMSAKFDYLKSGVWYEINSDFDGSVAKRDGVTPSLAGDGWTVTWDPFGLSEGNYLMRVSVADFDSTFVSDTITVYLDKQPLTPMFTSRSDLMSVCGAETVHVAIADENPTAVTFGFRYLPPFEERTLQLLRRNDYGDVNGVTTDGNHNYNGEFGEYYVAPAVLGSFMKHWFDKGYIELMAEGSTFQTVTQVVERFAELLMTRENLGTQDDNLVDALQQYIASHGNRFVVDVKRRPDAAWFRHAYMGRQATIMLAVDGPFGNWLAAQKVNFAASSAESLVVSYYDPVGGLLRESFLMTKGDSLVLGYLPNNRKYTVPLGIALYPKQETLTYTTFWTDFTFVDGFWGLLPPQYFQEDLLYLIRARALDGNNTVADNYWVAKYDCIHPAKHGDADNNSLITISDAVYLITYIFGGGPPPLTTTHGDADCNGLLSVSDPVYLITYIFGGGPPPCP